ncbi:DNA cytosine methyltransferase [Amycolatopsis lurida]|uniref:DNA cytosine methyltransferase n=1 Tax=Amycolatopsis lurida TaxID=31959 RepID=UPI00365FFD5D
MTPLSGEDDIPIGSLFSGYGGLCELAAAPLLRGRVAWHCDNDPAATKVLAHHWPDTPNLGDITAVDFTTVPPVRVLTGGFPCTDVSTAGRRAGIRPGTRSGLWSVMRHATAVLRPELVLIENVRGLLHAPAHSDVEPCPWCLGDEPDVPALRALGAVLADLADLGYDAAWCGLPASAVGAPHTRYRIFIAAAHSDREPLRPQPERIGRRGGAAVAELAGAVAADTEGHRRHERWPEPTRIERRPRSPLGGAPDPPVAWGQYEPAIRRWERVTGRPAPTPTVPGRRGNAVLNPELPEWMMGLPSGHITAVPGLSRVDMLRLPGNGVLAGQAIAALRYLLPLLGITAHAAEIQAA